MRPQGRSSRDSSDDAPARAEPHRIPPFTTARLNPQTMGLVGGERVGLPAAKTLAPFFPGSTNGNGLSCESKLQAERPGCRAETNLIIAEIDNLIATASSLSASMLAPWPLTSRPAWMQLRIRRGSPHTLTRTQIILWERTNSRLAGEPQMAGSVTSSSVKIVIGRGTLAVVKRHPLQRSFFEHFHIAAVFARD